MAISYPRTDFMDKAFIGTASFYPTSGESFSGTAGGIIIPKQLRPDLWYCKLQSVNLINTKARKLLAFLLSLRGVNTFYVSNPIAPYPQFDPDGSLVASSTVKINSVNVSTKAMSLKGLPSGYQLTEGDFLSFDYGSTTSRAFHQVLENATAGSDGTTAEFEVYPSLRMGAEADIVVTLRQPSAEMYVMPGTLNIQSVDPIRSYVAFEAAQAIY
jgi:hypothetical protein